MIPSLREHCQVRKIVHVENILTQVSLNIALRNSGHLENSVTDSNYSLNLSITSLNRKIRIILSWTPFLGFPEMFKTGYYLHWYLRLLLRLTLTLVDRAIQTWVKNTNHEHKWIQRIVLHIPRMAYNPHLYFQNFQFSWFILWITPIKRQLHLPILK